jgi:hypothetical protein
LPCNSREPKLVTGLLTARDNEVGVVNCATSNKKHLDDNQHLDGRVERRGRKDTYKTGETSDFIS